MSTPDLSPDIIDRLSACKRGPRVREVMQEFLLGLREADPEAVVLPGDGGWSAVDVKKRGRGVARIYPKNGLIKIDSFVPGSAEGDYGPEISLGNKGEWACRLPSNGEMPDQLLQCVADALAHVGGKRVRPPSSSARSPERAAAQRQEWGRSRLRSSTRFAVLVRDDFTCQYCGSRAPEVILHIDHRVPVSRGGGDDLENLIAACVDCNLGKGARHNT